ncbi:sensor histidine kinase, partial [Planctomycetota bacterium]
LEHRVLEKSKELEKAHERLLATEKVAATGRLAAGVAHEMNNPLASIAGYAEELRALAQQPQLKLNPAFCEFPDSLRVIEEQAYRCTRIIRRLLSFAAPAPPAIEVVSPGPMVEGVLPLVEHKARGRDVAVILDLDPEVPDVRANRSDLEQVLVNLLINAFDAIEGHTGQITVITRAAGASEVAIDLRDTGPGIPEAERRRIFDPFFTTKPLGQGTGLGLSICHALVERMRGRIEVSSRVGEGTTFTILLPVQVGEDSAPGGQLTDEEKASQE